MSQDWDELFRQMDEWTRAMDRFMDHIVGARPPAPSFALARWRPAVNVYETRDAIVVIVELAGVDPDAVTVRFEPGRLLIWGRRREALSEETQTIHRMEIQSGPFALEIPLPGEVDPEQTEASYANGFLEVRLPKRAAPSRQSITIRIPPEERSSA